MSGFIEYGNATIQFGDGPPIPVTDVKVDIKFEFREPCPEDLYDAWASWNRRPAVLKARETEPGVWEVPVRREQQPDVELPFELS